MLAVFVLAYRCGAAPDSHRIPSFDALDLESARTSARWEVAGKRGQCQRAVERGGWQRVREQLRPNSRPQSSRPSPEIGQTSGSGRLHIRTSKRSRADRPRSDSARLCSRGRPAALRSRTRHRAGSSRPTSGVSDHSPKATPLRTLAVGSAGRASTRTESALGGAPRPTSTPDHGAMLRPRPRCSRFATVTVIASGGRRRPSPGLPRRSGRNWPAGAHQ
jgi:hypothetical protein